MPTLKRVLLFIFTMWQVITATFFLMKALPGDPYTEDRPLTSIEKQQMEKYFGFDQPLSQQYVTYLKKLATLDLGSSLVYRSLPVTTILRQGFPVSALLGIEALLFALSIGIFLASTAALFPSKRTNSLFSLFLIFGLSLPSFVLATLLQYVFGYKLQWLPIARLTSFSHTLLPALSLSLFPLVMTARQFKTSLETVLEEDYVLAARAKGLSSFALFKGHLLKNSCLPLIPIIPPLIVNTLIGSFVIEHIFAIPGLGKWLISGVQNRDYPVILGTTLFYTFMLLTLTLLSDIMRRLLDPRETA